MYLKFRSILPCSPQHCFTGDDPTSSSAMASLVGVGFLPSADSGDVLQSIPDEDLVEKLEEDDRVSGEMHDSAPFPLFLRDNDYYYSNLII